jgi:hypothetical protein
MDTRIILRCADLAVASGFLAAAVMAAGCHLVIGIEDLPPLDAASGTVDAKPGTVDAPPGAVDARVDAAPGELVLYGLSPTTVDEGMGVARPVPVAIMGANIAQGAMVRLFGPGQDGQPRPLQVSADGTLAAFEVAIPVQTTLAENATETVTVEVLQGDQMQSLALAVDWLDELVATVYGASRNFTFATDELDAKYSRIEIDATMASAGLAPLRLVATAEIVLAAGVTATGIAGGADNPGEPGPGGCAGGAEGENGDCAPGGGLGADASQEASGGGGGHAGPGSTGTGTSAGVGGGNTGTAAMTDLAREHGNGGGGGGSAGTGRGGGGGGGGGVIELTSLGTFSIELNARLSVQGGNGGGCGGSGGNGGGGGGSGGAILLRSARPIEDRAGGDLLVVAGGPGGTGGSCNQTGGAGALGRARVDAPALPDSASSAAPYHGAVLDPATPTIVDESTLALTVLGKAGTSYAVASPLTTPRAVQLDGSGRGTQNVTLMPGINRVCALVVQTDMRLVDGENCLDVAYVP